MKVRGLLLTASSALVLGAIAVPRAWAQSNSTALQASTSGSSSEPIDLTDPSQIVVIGNRSIIASLEDVPVEQEYDEDRVASYGVDSVGELIDAIRDENGDEEPTLLVNGRPVRDNSDISDYPVEAIRRVEALPRGSASRVGGPAGQRAYNVVLRTSVRSVTLTASAKAATEGAWHELRGDATATYIKGQDRLNLTLKAAGSDGLLQSDRGVVAVAPTYPYSAFGNVIAFNGTEIDPALSQVAGGLVTVAGVPVGGGPPTLAEIAAAPLNSPDVTRYRSLRGEGRSYDAALSGSKAFASWLSLSFNARLGWTYDERLNGLAAARALLPTTNAHSPFAGPVLLAINDPSRPLVNASKGGTVSLSGTFNATFGAWRATVAGKYDERSRDYAYQFVETIPGGLLTFPDTVDPFSGRLGALIPIGTRATSSRTTVREIQADVEGPLVDLPAGSLRLRAGAGVTWLNLFAINTGGITNFSRRELEGRVGISLPLISGARGPLRSLGDLELTIDAARSDLGPFGALESRSLALNWQPLAWMRISASQRDEERTPAPELLSAPTLVSESVPYFDPVTGETVDVTMISGGAGNLQNERQRIRQVSLNLTPWKKYNLQLNADFRTTDLFNQFGGLPSPTPAVVAAFPDRFERDGAGRLVLVDARTVNFAQQSASELRTSIAFTIPLYKRPAQPVRRAAGSPPVSRRRPTLQVNLAHTHLFRSTSTIREALGPVDLLSGTAVGLGGGRPRDTIDGSVTLSDRGTGLRGSAVWRGPSYLATGTLAAPDRLRFAGFVRVDLKAYADLGNLFPGKKLAKGMRVTFQVDNLFNRRQPVFDSAGLTPLGYQPAYREPIGRTIMLELRKVF